MVYCFQSLPSRYSESLLSFFLLQRNIVYLVMFSINSYIRIMYVDSEILMAVNITKFSGM
jgi:hypothetical protein